MHDRDRAYKRAKLTGNLADFEHFKALRRSISNDIDTAKNTHFALKLANAPNTALKWREIRKLGITGLSRPSPLTCFSPAALNAHYAAVSVTARRPPPLPDSTSHLHQPITALPLTKFHFATATQADILRIINSSTSKASGPDGISSEMLKIASAAICSPLTSIVNFSLKHSVFPDLWKRAFLSPLAKIAVMASMSDTRPIAKLSEPSKVLERLVHEQFSTFLEENGLLNPRQSGFRKGHSTQTALLGVLDDVRLAIDKRKITALVLFDFSKAFDTVPHDLLLHKLRRLRCSDPALDWFYDYLHGRLQTVIDEGGTTTDWIKVLAGVPQGSVLGPLLFMVFINDLPSILLHSRSMIFADDTQIYYSFYPADLEQGIRNISTDAEAVAKWASDNGLSLNLAKTKAMLLGSEKFISRLDLQTIPKVTIMGQALPYATAVKNLGVWITPTLSWTKHVNQVVGRVFGALHSLKHCKHSLTQQMRKNLVESLIFPHFDYACPVFHDLDKTRTLKLQTALNACVRFVCGNIPWRDHVTPHRVKLGWLSAAHRREYLIGTLGFNVIAHKNPAYLAENFTRLADLQLRTSSRLPPRSLCFPAHRTEAMSGTFQITAARIINRLPPTSFVPENATAFKSSLHSALLEEDRRDWVARMSAEGIAPPAID